MSAQSPADAPDPDRPLAGLASWDAGEQIPNHLYARMIGHARFAAAVRAMAEGLLELSASDRAIDGIFKDAGRYVAAACVATMPSGVTLAGVKTLCSKFGLLSPGRAGAMLLYLRYLGYVSPGRDRSAGRPARYLPSPTFLAAWKAHLRVVLAAASLIEPQTAQVSARLDEPEFFECFCRVQLDGFVEGTRHWNPDMAFVRVFMNRHAGTQIGWTLLEQPDALALTPASPLDVSKAALARRFDVSLMHVRRLFAEAGREGLIAQDDSHRLFLTDLARDQIKFLYSAQLIRLITACARTLAAMERSAGDLQGRGFVPPNPEIGGGAARLAG